MDSRETAETAVRLILREIIRPDLLMPETVAALASRIVDKVEDMLNADGARAPGEA